MLELLLFKEKLLPGAEDEVLSAINALQRPVGELHKSIPTCYLGKPTSDLDNALRAP